ncbi:MAG: GNAT family N-acetyltransferase [Gaiellales bacterium]
MTEDAEARATMVDFLRRLALADATLVERLPFGFAALHPELHRAYDLNLVWVDDAVVVGAADLVAEGERLAVQHGFEHCEVIVPDEPAAVRLRPELAAAGYAAEPRLLMVARRRPERQPSCPVAEIDLTQVTAVTEATLRQSPESFDEETVGQLCAAKRVVVASGGRFLGARAADGTLASICDVYSDGTTAQIESVITLKAYRGQGLASSLVLHAVDDARRAGHELVFLQADENDWPRHLYTKLGFDPVGVVTRFLRAPSRPGVPH